MCAGRRGRNPPHASDTVCQGGAGRGVWPPRCCGRVFFFSSQAVLATVRGMMRSPVTLARTSRLSHFVPPNYRTSRPRQSSIRYDTGEFGNPPRPLILTSSSSAIFMSSQAASAIVESALNQR